MCNALKLRNQQDSYYVNFRMLKQAAIDNVEQLAASENKNIYKKHAEGDI